MKLKIICVGKLKEKFYTAAVNEFTKRISRFAETVIIEVPDESAPEKSSAADIEKVKCIEGTRILEKLSPGETLIALDIAGKQLSSVEFSEKIQDYMLSGKSRLVFAIGGSNGLSQEVLNRADFRLSFSRMTFSHQIFRTMLLEQLYRAFKIINNEPYHK